MIFSPREQGHNFCTTISLRNDGSLTIAYKRTVTDPTPWLSTRPLSCFSFNLLSVQTLLNFIVGIIKKKKDKKIIEALRRESLDYCILIIHPDCIWGSLDKTKSEFSTI